MSQLLTKAFALAVFFAVIGCAAPVKHNTASGKVEVVLVGTPDQAKAKIVGMMVNFGYNVSKDTSYLIAFDRPSDNFMANVLLGSNYDRTPNARITYMFSQMGPNTRVIVDAALITNPGSAFERVTPMNNNVDTLKIQSWLNRMAAGEDPNTFRRSP